MKLTAQRATEILAAADPVRLISMGAPSDEYGYEARRLASKLREGMSRREVERVVWSVFESCFNSHRGRAIVARKDVAGAADALLAALAVKS